MNYDYLSTPSHSVSAYRTPSLSRAVGADIDHKHPDVAKDLLDWGKWIISTLGDGVAGFRFDAIKHIERDFIANFINRTRQDSGQPYLFAVGEFWAPGSPWELFEYLDGVATQVRSVRGSVLPRHSSPTQFSVFDVPLHYNFQNAANHGRDYDIRKIWDGTVVEKRPIDAVYVCIPLSGLSAYHSVAPSLTTMSKPA